MPKTFVPTVVKQFLILTILYCLSASSWAINNTQNLQINNKQITVELADTQSKRSQGLMYRTELAENNGMLFVFDNENWHCFWMKNTQIPLAIAFINQQKIIIDIQQMQANTLDSHCPPEKIGLALEMNAGWFQKNNIQPGDKINLN